VPLRKCRFSNIAVVNEMNSVSFGIVSLLYRIRANFVRKDCRRRISSFDSTKFFRKQIVFQRKIVLNIRALNTAAPNIK